MSDDCVFCRIVAGEIPSYTVHDGESVYAFLDANPLARGHTLVVPKDHHERVADLPPETSDAVFGAVRRIAPAVERAVGADGVTIGVNDGAAAGQEVPHVHAHVVPRETDDGVGPIHALDWPRPEIADDEFPVVAESIGEEL